MNDRDCDNCAHHSEGGCSVWECSYEQKEDDTISRQAAIDAICGECQANCIPCESFPCGEIKAIQALPSAQPTQTDTSNTLKALDCVERQAAINAANRADYRGLTVEDVKKVTDEVVKEIKKLPPAQSDNGYSDGFTDGYKRGLTDAQPDNQINLCDSCDYSYPDCPSESDDVIFGNGIGNDNICACNKYKPSAQQEIVRCKDCKWYELPSHKITENCVRWMKSNGILLPIKPNDYCSYAERREE